MKKQKAFTLVELMVVMAVVAILATAGLAAYSGYIKKSRDTARAEIAQKLNTAVMSYAASNGGNPPADQNAFESFLASAGEVFSGSGVTSTTLFKDPVGGAEVCLNADKQANQPCSFHYTAYDDGTYAISYGVESESSLDRNFYKTTNSVLSATATNNTGAAVERYGVYVGSAKYIGQDATANTTSPGVDVAYYSTDNVLFKSSRIDIRTATSGGVSATCSPACTTGQSCINGACITTSTIAVGASCGTIGAYATIKAKDGRCWFTTDLDGRYQWGRSDTTFTPAPNSPWDWNNPQENNLWTSTGGINNPCPTGFRVPTKDEWQTLITEELKTVSDLTNSTLHLSISGLIGPVSALVDEESAAYGYYWSSSPSVAQAFYMGFGSNFANIDQGYRANGLLVRCIQD